MEQSLPQASSLPYLMSFYMLFLLPNGKCMLREREHAVPFHVPCTFSVFTTSMSLRVWPRTGWYVHDRNRGLHIRFQCLEESGTKVVWMFKGQNLSASSPCIDGATRTVCGPMLHISKFQYEYAGNYTCKNPSTGREVHVPLGGKCVGLLVISFSLLLSVYLLKSNLSLLIVTRLTTLQQRAKGLT